MTEKRRTIDLCTFSSAQSSEENIEPPVTATQYNTANSSIITKWKKSIKRKMTHSTNSSQCGEKRFDIEEASVDIGALISYDELPQDYSSDSVDNDELSVKICKEGVRNSLQEMMKALTGDTRLLEAIEDNSICVIDTIRAAGEEERNVAFLWAAFLKRRDLLPEFLPGCDLKYCTSDDGLTALHLAAFSGSSDCVRFLLTAGSKFSQPQVLTPLHCAALGHSTECIRLLLATGAAVNPETDPCVKEPTDSPLHCAVQANAPECIQQLLRAGADPSVIGRGGMTALHVAADLAYTDCVRALLESKKSIDVNAKTQDRKENTALHLAAEEECVDSIKLLLEHGAEAIEKNFRGQTPLHLAARVQSTESVFALLPHSDVNAGDTEKRTPLHVAVGRAFGAVEMAEMLASAPGVNINQPDRYGHTPLHVAALNELPAASAVLIRHGADLTARTKRGATALGLVIRKVPAALYAIEELLDSSIRMSYETNRDRDVELRLDFKPLLSSARRIEVSLLSTFIAEGHPELLQHPLCQAFLHLKWQTIRKFYFLRLMLCFVFVLCLSLYVLTFLTNKCSEDIINHEPLFPNGDKRPLNLSSNCATDTIMGGIKRTNKTYIFCLHIINYLLLFFAAVELVRKLYGLIAALSSPSAVSLRSSLISYICEIDNILEWFTLISIPLISNFFWNHLHSLQTPLGAFAILAGWTNLMLLVGQLPLFGAYVAMYTCVLREFIKLLGAYICLLIGFAISFCVIFPNANDFANPLIAMVKVLVMMTGEMEFNDLLLKDEENPSEKNLTDISGVSKSAVLDISAHVIFVFCLLFVTVALMNLLVGIAVHDIHGLRTSAGLSKLIRQADLVGYVETALSGCFSCRTYKSSISQLFSTRLRCVQNARHARSNSTILHVKPNNPLDSRLPRDIVKSAFEVAKRKRPQGPNRHTYQRSSSQNTNTTNVPKRDVAKSTSTRRRTMYIKNDKLEQEEHMDMEDETIITIKQLAEDMQEMRTLVLANQEILRKILAADRPICE